MMEFSGRTAMITGGGSGMGALAGEQLAAQGANVALLDVNEEALTAVAERISWELFFCFPRFLSYTHGYLPEKNKKASSKFNYMKDFCRFYQFFFVYAVYSEFF